MGAAKPRNRLIGVPRFYIIYWLYDSLPHFNDELISYLYVYCFSVCIDGYESLPERETSLFLLISTNKKNLRIEGKPTSNLAKGKRGGGP